MSRMYQVVILLVVSALGACSGDEKSAVDVDATDGALDDAQAPASDAASLSPDPANADGGGADPANADGGGADPANADGGGADPASADGGDAGSAEPCGDGIVDAQEQCDLGIASSGGKCPTSCDDSDACTTDTLSGAGTCDAECSFVDITDVVDGDGCCLPGTTGDQDDDCPPTRLDLSLDESTISTELGTSHTVTVTLDASEGFAGDVQLEASALDDSDTVLSTWMVQLVDTDLVLAEDGSESTQLTIAIPTAREALVATVKVIATSSAMAGSSEDTVNIDLLDQFTIETPVVSGQCVYPPAGTTQLKVGTTVRWLNTNATGNVTIHVNPNANGCPHQSDPGSAPGSAYQCPLAGLPGSSFNWYCHAPGPMVNDRYLQVVP